MSPMSSQIIGPKPFGLPTDQRNRQTLAKQYTPTLERGSVIIEENVKNLYTVTSSFEF